MGISPIWIFITYLFRTLKSSTKRNSNISIEYCNFQKKQINKLSKFNIRCVSSTVCHKHRQMELDIPFQDSGNSTFVEELCVLAELEELCKLAELEEFCTLEELEELCTLEEEPCVLAELNASNALFTGSEVSL